MLMMNWRVGQINKTRYSDYLKVILKDANKFIYFRKKHLQVKMKNDKLLKSPKRDDDSNDFKKLIDS